jgi:high mobility group protein B1
MSTWTFAKQITTFPLQPLSSEPTPSLVSPQSTDNSSTDGKKPRKNRSAYTLFALDIKPKIKAASNYKMSCVDLQTSISQLWKALTSEERKKYQDQANEEKLHYMLKLKKFYENASPETLEEAAKPKPKRPYSAYCYFVKEIRHIIKLPDAKFKMQEILKQASEKWRTIGEEEKAIYHEKARQARENYMSEATDCSESVESARLEEVLESASVIEEIKPKKTPKESKASSTKKKERPTLPQGDPRENGKPREAVPCQEGQS